VEKFGKLRKNAPVDTDGIVIKPVENAKITELMGYTAHHPSAQMAFKYKAKGETTEILDIELDIGKTGRVTFRGRVKPVNIDGVTIQYASLHNANWMAEKDVRIGSIIELKRANDVIPYVSAVINNPASAKKFKMPENCPLCGALFDTDSRIITCPNPNCESRVLPALEDAVSRRGLDIAELSTKTLEALIEHAEVRDIGDILNLDADTLTKLPVGVKEDSQEGFAGLGLEQDSFKLGQKTADKIMVAIDNTKQNAPLERVLVALNINKLALEVAQKLVAYFGNIEAIQKATVEQFCEVDLVSDKKAKFFVDGFAEKRGLIDKMKNAQVRALE
jgi:DNA ligase (NAD+)